MSDTAYTYARFDGDSRSSWERLTWIERQPRARAQRNDDATRFVIDDPVVISEEISEPGAGNQGSGSTAAGFAAASRSDDRIDFNLRRWDSFDFLTTLGVLLLIIGFVLTFLPELRKAGILVPVGLGIMTLGVYCAHRRDEQHLS